MAFDIVVRDKIQRSIKTKLDGINLSSTRSVESIRRLRAQLNGLNARTGMAGTSTLVGRLNTNLGKTNKQVALLSSGFTRATNASRRLLSGALLLQAADGFVDSLDAYSNLQNRLRGVSAVFDNNGIKDAIKSQERLNELTRQMFGIADRARVPVSSLAKTYRRLDMALQEMGESQAKSLELTETVSKLLTLAGSTAQESASALLQLGQAFNKAKLDGDEFRSVAELMPRAVRAITDVLKNDLGDKFTNIYDAAEKGLIRSTVILKAFTKIQKEVEKEFEDMPRTIGHAFTQLTNAITKAFGSSSDANSFMSKLIRAIDWLKNNLPIVVRLMKTFIGVMALQSIGGLLANFVGSLFSAAGWVNILATGISALTGYFIYFADQIKVTGDGLVTLNDLFIATYQVIRDHLTKGGGLLGSIFSEEGAQKAFDVLQGFMKGIMEGWNRLSSIAQAVYRTWMGLDWADIPTLMLDGWLALQYKIKDLAIDAAKFIIKVFSKLVNKLGSLIYKGLEHISSALADSVPAVLPFSEAITDSLEKITIKMRELKNAPPLDLGLSKWLEDMKTDYAEVVPLFHSIFRRAREETDEQSAQSAGIFQQHYQDAFNETEIGFRELMDSIFNIARDNVDARIKEEKRFQNSILPNPDALRQSRRDDSVLFFGRGSKRRREERGSRSRIIDGSVNNPQLNNGIQFFGKNARKRWEDSVGGASGQSTFTNKSQALNNFSSRVRDEMEAVKSLERSTENVRSSRSSIDNVNRSVRELSRQTRDLSFDEPRLSVDRYETQATQSLRKLSNVNFDVADHIERKQTQAWRNARSEVEAFANYAMAILMRIAELREKARPRTDAWGRPADTRRFIRAPGNVPVEISRRDRDGMFIGSGSSGQQPNFNTQWDSWGPLNAGWRSGGFASGGYTGNIGRNRIAGVVHGGEYVMPAEATSRYRPLLEAMRSGQSVGTSSSSGAGTTMKVNIENYGSSTHQVQQISANEVRIIAREAVETGATNVIARELSQPNSLISKSINHNLRSQRRR